jgi:hypothetical protein
LKEWKIKKYKNKEVLYNKTL